MKKSKLKYLRINNLFIIIIKIIEQLKILETNKYFFHNNYQKKYIFFFSFSLSSSSFICYVSIFRWKIDLKDPIRNYKKNIGT